MSLLSPPTDVASQWRAKEVGGRLHGDILRQTWPDLVRLSCGSNEDLEPNRPPPPQPDLDVRTAREYSVYSDLAEARVAFIGAGAGALCLAAYLTSRGADAGNMTFFDPQAKPGGIWNHRRTQFGGFNNPRPLRFSDEIGLSIDDRRGKNMKKFLRRITDGYLADSRFESDAAVDLSRSARANMWEVTGANGTAVNADFVVMANGRPQPNAIHGPRIKSNLETAAKTANTRDLLIERNQRKLSAEDATNGRPIILMGLGNSTAAMLNEIQRIEKESGVAVDYVVLTNRTSQEVENPEKSFGGRLPIFRNPPKGYLTGYSGDLERDRIAYERALDACRIVPGTHEVYFDTHTSRLIVHSEYSTPNILYRPHIFALLGHKTDDSLRMAAGGMTPKQARKRGSEVPPIRPVDGAVWTKKDAYASNIFAIGSCAATSANPNAAVIPGIFGQIPSTALTMGIRTHLRA